MPPKVYLYEPKIFGFNIHGKRGSKAYQEPIGAIKYIEDSLQQMEKEKLVDKIKEANSLKNQLLNAPLEGLHNLSGVPTSAKKVIAKEETKQSRGRQMNQTADNKSSQVKQQSAAQQVAEEKEDEEATVIDAGKKEGKKNRKRKNKGGQ